MGLTLNSSNCKNSKGSRLNWPSAMELSQVNFNNSSNPVKLSDKDLASIRQSKGKPLVP